MTFILPSFGASAISAVPGGGGGAFTNTYSLDFDGTNDFIQTSYRPSAGSTFSASFWMKSSDTSSSMGWFSLMDAFATYGIFLTTPSSTKGWYYGWNGVTRNATIGGSNATLAVRDGSWHHVAMTVNGTTVKIYTDGTIVGTDTAPSAYSGPTSGSGSGGTGPDLDYVIGRGYAVSAYQYNGLIDELAFFETELTGSNISAIYNSGQPADLGSGGLNLNPTAWYRMGDGGTWDGSNWSIPDASVNSNTATSTNMVEADRVTDVPVAFTNTYSVELDGTNDFVNLGSSSDFDSVSAFTISSWIKADSFSGYPMILSKTNATVGKAFQLYIDESSSKPTLTVNFSSSASSTDTISTGVWTHIAVTWTSGTGAVAFYINGSASGTATGSTSITTNTDDCCIGAKPSGAGFSNFFNGIIDEVSFFNSALSALDVTAIYNSGVPADLTSYSPVGWWRMGDNNSGTGTTITDQGSGSNNGTLTNGPTFSTDVPS
jgi:hypothetical protein